MEEINMWILKHFKFLNEGVRVCVHVCDIGEGY